MKRWLLTALLALAGCSNYEYVNLNHAQNQRQQALSEIVQTAQQLDYRKYENLEEMLFEDISDGKIDMPLERAVLTAGDCEKVMLEYWEEKMNALCQEVLEAVAKSKHEDDLEKARAIAREIQTRIKQQEFQYKMDFLINKDIRKGNCVVSSVLFSKACEKVGIRVGFVSNLKHMFNYVEQGGKKNYIDITEKTLAPEKFHLEDEFLHEPSREEIISDIYCLKAIMLRIDGKLKDAEKQYLNGLAIFPKNQAILENLVNLHAWFNYEKALEYLNLYSLAYPKNASLHAHKASVLKEIGRNKEALAEIEKAISLNERNKSYQELRESILRGISKK